MTEADDGAGFLWRFGLQVPDRKASDDYAEHSGHHDPSQHRSRCHLDNLGQRLDQTPARVLRDLLQLDAHIPDVMPSLLRFLFQATS